MNQYVLVIPIIVIIWVLLLSLRIGAHMDSQIDKDNPRPVIEVPKKVCPLHDWRWLDQPGMEDVSYMICLTCKKTPRQVGENP